MYREREDEEVYPLGLDLEGDCYLLGEMELENINYLFVKSTCRLNAKSDLRVNEP